MVIILTVVELLILPKTLNILDPRSTVGSWINNAVVVKNSHVSSEDAVSLLWLGLNVTLLYVARYFRVLLLTIV